MSKVLKNSINASAGCIGFQTSAWVGHYIGTKTSLGVRNIRPSPYHVPMNRMRVTSALSDNRRNGLAKRRDFLLYGMFCAVGVPAAALGQVHSEISELYSKLPGAGKPDIFYPEYFQGEWILNRVLYQAEAAPELTEKDYSKSALSSPSVLSKQGFEKLRSQLGTKKQYGVRFIRFHGHVIEDRRSTARVEIGLSTSENSQRVDVTWNADNPNILSATWDSGRLVREVKVTKRAFTENTENGGSFACSEYARVADLVEQDALVRFGKAPSIYARRRIARYAPRYVGQADEMQLVGIDRFVVEYLYAPTGVGSERALITAKYRDKLDKVTA